MSKRYSQGLLDTHIVAGSKHSFRWYNLLTKMIVSYVLSLHLFSLRCCSIVVSPCWHPTMSHLYVVFFLSFNFSVCICLVLTLLGLRCSAWAFSCGKQGIFSNCREWDSHCRAWTPGRMGWLAVAHRLFPRGPWHLLGPAIEPMFLHWQAASIPLSHQGSPMCCFLSWKSCCLQVACFHTPLLEILWTTEKTL